MRIRFLRSLTDAEVVAIAAAAGVHQVPQPGTVYPKGSEWHFGADVAEALCTEPQVIEFPVAADAPEGTKPERIDFGVAAEALEEPAPAPAPDPAPPPAPLADASWDTPSDQE